VLLLKWSLPLIPKSARLRAIVWGALIFALAYGMLGSCPWREPVQLPLSPLDQLPLLPWTLLIYLSDYAFLLLVLASLQKVEDFSVAYYRLIASIVISFLVFLLFPTVYPRPTLPMDPLWSETFLFLHFLDQPTNCLPSLHVSLTLIAGASLQSWRPALRRGAYLWVAAICLSTLTTKQHYAWDVLGGMLVATASLYLIPRLPAK
jgi:membrane-associated phospholipid phosphatase